mgnify:CR=1 FL=1
MSITVQIITIDNQDMVYGQQHTLVQSDKIAPGAGKQIPDT